MKKKLIGALIFVALLFPILIAHQVRAHELDNHPNDSIVASSVNISSEADVKALLEHAMKHWLHAALRDDYIPPVLDFRAKLREEGSAWKHRDVYLIRMTGEGDSIILHPYHPAGQSGSLNDPAGIGQMLISRALENPEVPQCAPYSFEGKDRWACAMQVPSYRGGLQVFVSGFHHNFEDLSFSHIECDPFVPETTAADVVDDETLAAFVRGAVDYYIRVLTTQGGEAVLRTRVCMRQPPWQEGSIYLFRSALSGRVIFHGLSPVYEDATWENIEDKTGKKIFKALRDVANALGPFEGGYLEYYWDDPADPDDDVDVEQCPKGPLTCAPGTSLKRTYLVRMPKEATGLDEDLFFASGIYPEEESGGCNLSTGRESKDLGFMAGLILIGAIIFLAKRKKRGAGCRI